MTDVELFEYCKAKGESLLASGIEFYEQKKYEAYQQMEIGKIEYCGFSDLHRGFYCPSPVYDIIVGNTRRGRLIAKPKANSKISHKYHYGLDGKLLYDVKSGDATEYLVTDGATRRGYTIYFEKLWYIAEETFENGRIVEYLHCCLANPYSDIRCGSSHYEAYTYNDGKISVCDQSFLNFPNNYIWRERYSLHYRGDRIVDFSRIKKE